MGLSLPLLGMGTWGMGGKYEADTSNIEESIEALRYGFDHGLTLVDVAELYGQGLTEKIVAQALEGYDRSKFLITSKVWRTNLSYDAVLHAAEGSLERLNTSYIDIYLIHWPNPEFPLAETMRAFERLVDEGKIRHIGVSNFSAIQMKEASQYLTSNLLEVSQFEYNITVREAEQLIIPYCRERNIAMMAYRPFNKGLLNHQSNPVIEELMEKYGKTCSQLLLNWIISQGIMAIPKAGTIEHMKENIGALGWELSREDHALLAEHFVLQ